MAIVGVVSVHILNHEVPTHEANEFADALSRSWHKNTEDSTKIKGVAKHNKDKVFVFIRVGV